MDARAHQRTRARLAGLVAAGARFALLAAALLALVAGIEGGLTRLGISLGAPQIAVASHGALMVAGFLGAVISLERAIALGAAWGYSAPLASALGTVALLAGWHRVGLGFWLVAPLFLVAVSVRILWRQTAPHTFLMVVAAVAWILGNAFHMKGGPYGLAYAWWFTFLVLTIAAERLEMTRLMKRRRLATPLFVAAVAVVLAGAAIFAIDSSVGTIVFGAGLVATAAWLGAFDIARHTVRGEGYARYAAFALLGGYAWLAIAGFAWALLNHSSVPLRDVALHAVGLGFVVSMIFAHAPVIVPVILRRPMRFSPFLYVPLVLLHVSLVLRLGFGLDDFADRARGGVLGAVAIALFAAAMLYITVSRRTPPEFGDVPRTPPEQDPSRNQADRANSGYVPELLK
jgi:hypothetical protein